MLKITGSSDSAPRLRANDNEVVGDDDKADNRNLLKSKKSKNAKSGKQTCIGATGEPIFLIPGTREAFNQLRQAFTEAPILRHFDLECHIRIETNASGYTIKNVLSWLTSDHLISNQGQWHPMAYFLKKIIPSEIWYETHNGKLLAIIEAFKTWRHYLKVCKHKVLVLTDHNNLRQFMNIKSLSFRQIRWA